MPLPVLTSHLIGHSTPCYYYNVSLLDATLKEVHKHGIDKGYHVHFALKANHEPYILKKENVTEAMVHYFGKLCM